MLKQNLEIAHWFIIQYNETRSFDIIYQEDIAASMKHISRSEWILELTDCLNFS